MLTNDAQSSKRLMCGSCKESAGMAGVFFLEDFAFEGAAEAEPFRFVITWHEAWQLYNGHGLCIKVYKWKGQYKHSKQLFNCFA